MNVTAQLRPALMALLAFTVLTGIAYPLLVTGVATLVSHDLAGGSLIRRDGQVVGSDLIGQSFSSPGFFWGRPSATGPVPYNAGASSGSNLGNANPALLEAVRDRAAALRQAHPGHESEPIPLDLLTASASGLDPHIQPESAYYQVDRVAAARGLDPAGVRELVARHVEGRSLGFLGEPRVNVLRLNLALAEMGGR
jgi:K+-transporting ATPase ATPase C chain